MPCSRLLMFRNFRIVSESAVTSLKPSYSKPRNYGTITRVGLGQPQYRFYTDYILPTRGYYTLLLFKKAKNNYSESGSVMTHHAQLALRRLFKRFTLSGSGFRHVSKFGQAVVLFITRPNFVLPGSFAITSGKLAWAQRSPATTDQSKNTLYIRAQDGHAFMASLILSALEGVILFLRALYLGILFSPSIIMMPFVSYCGPEFRRLWLHVVHRTLEKAGPAFIKWGQWAATRPDLFPRDLCIKLSELHMKAPEHSFAYTKKTIEGAFGRELPEIFENFEEEPVASGSIAQVHRATLRFRYPNQKVKPMVVAVKVRHPGVSESIRRDFVIINSVAKLSMLIPALKWWRLDESVQQFSVFMMSQVDLAREAAHLSRFIYNFRHHKDVSFPKPLYPLVHPAVLVETYEQGECVSNYLHELPGQDKIKAAVAHSGTKAYLKMLLVDNYIHADMHPGNILVRVPPQSNSLWKKLFKLKPHVIFLDVGMTAELSRTDQVNLVGLFKAIACRDGATAAECTLRLSNQQKCPNPEAFIEEMKEAFTFWGSPEGDLVHPAECMHQVLEKVRRHRVNVDGNVCTVMVTTLVLEGWQRKLDPAYNVMQTLQMYAGYQNSKLEWAESLSYTIQALMAP
ncbi:uncharacterized protein LOC126790518 [Argentina anserina]|uniref:uncharacterized protein LOC126790518 n=1 Tax=Argentina anserina TaxID=57926 RepID=UPI0021763DCE|nr:uncharacterized protein LOC126790518 [Potentilla anserina]